MTHAAITSYVDVAQLVLYAFWIFFFGLCAWLVRENRREGYPLESDRGAHEGWIRPPGPKTFRIAADREISVPGDRGAPLPGSLQPLHGHGGSAFEPVGDPMRAGVGPGAWAARHDEVELDLNGEPKIRPLALLPAYGVSDRDPDPRGMDVRDARGTVAGTVRDLWLDVPECQFRYLAVTVPLAGGGTRDVLLPVPFARITRRGVEVQSLLAPQFADVPATRAADRVTVLEEERIAAYYGGGLLYAEPSRAEPLV